MALIDHFAPDAGLDTGAGENGFVRIASHEFATVVAIAGNGTFGGATPARARIISEFNLQTADEAQLDLIIAAFMALTTDGDRAKFLRDLEDSLIGYESGHITVAEAASNVGL